MCSSYWSVCWVFIHARQHWTRSLKRLACHSTSCSVWTWSCFTTRADISLLGNKQITRDAIPYGILSNLRKHIEHESLVHVQRTTFIYWSLAELGMMIIALFGHLFHPNSFLCLETLLPLFLKMGYIPLLSSLLSQHEDKEIHQSVLGFLTWFQKTGMNIRIWIIKTYLTRLLIRQFRCRSRQIKKSGAEDVGHIHGPWLEQHGAARDCVTCDQNDDWLRYAWLPN